VNKTRTLPSHEKCLRECTAGGPVYTEPKMTIHDVARPGPTPKPAPDPHGFRRQLAHHYR
jgi:hypothetical protein